MRQLSNSGRFSQTVSGHRVQRIVQALSWWQAQGFFIGSMVHAMEGDEIQKGMSAILIQFVNEVGKWLACYLKQPLRVHSRDSLVEARKLFQMKHIVLGLHLLARQL